MKNIIVLCATVFLVSSAWGEPTLTLLPSGNISGPPGSLIGWGFTITNDADYIEITSSAFCLNPVSFPACTVPDEGTFTDFISQYNDIVVGYNGGTDPDRVSQSFDPTVLTGIGSFSVAPNASISGEDFGQIVLTYDVWDADPNTAPDANLLLSDQVLSADATVFVSPEPASFVSAAGALSMLLAWRTLLSQRRR